MNRNIKWFDRVLSLCLALILSCAPLTQAAMALEGEEPWEPVTAPVDTSSGQLPFAEEDEEQQESNEFDQPDAVETETEPADPDGDTYQEEGAEAAPPADAAPEGEEEEEPVFVQEQDQPVELAEDGLNYPIYGFGFQAGFGTGPYDTNYGSVMLRDWFPSDSADSGAYFGVEKEGISSQYRGIKELEGDYVSRDGNVFLYFAFLPQTEELGRVPDREFEGWYGYPNDETPQDRWRYSDGLRRVESKELDAARLTELEDETVGAGGSFGSNYSGFVGYEWTDLITESLTGEHNGLEDGDDGMIARLVARWKASTHAEGREVAVTTEQGAPVSLYTSGGEEFAAQPLPEDTAAFDPTKTEYYLRVGADVEKIDLSFTAYEPYYEYHITNRKTGTPPISMTLHSAGASSEALEPVPLTDSEILPTPELQQDKINTSQFVSVPQNSFDDPARSVWTFMDIPLSCSAGQGKYYNDIVITVTAPDGETSIDYTFHVQRLADPVLVQNPGNTPAGMIERETGMSEADKDQLRTLWREARTVYQDTANFPKLHSEINGGGAIYQGVYKESLRPGLTSFDDEPAAVVAYLDANFLDPGFTLYDCKGDPVTVGADGTGPVTRDIALRQTDALTPDLLQDGAGSEEVYSKTLDTDGQQVKLEGANVLPGVYEIVYTYTDPISGKSYSNQEGDFAFPDPAAKAEMAAGFRRTLVVLPKPGDLNMDGVVNRVDGYLLKNNMTLNNAGDNISKLFQIEVAKHDVAALVAARALDVNGDGKVNVTDRELLQGEFAPSLSTTCNYYYLPLPTGDEDGQRPITLPDAGESDNGAASLELEYLGCAETPNTTGTVADEVDLYDTFWVGVRLNGQLAGSPLAQPIQTMTVSLAYNSKYVIPADSLGNSNMVVTDVDRARWLDLIRSSNTVTSTAKTAWRSGNYGFADNDLGSYPERALSDDLTRARTALEAAAGDYARELTVTIMAKSSNMTTPTAGDYLLIVPFRLVKYPFGQVEPTLVSLSLGGQSFSLQGAEGSAAFDVQSNADAMFGSASEGTAIHRNLRAAVYLPKGPGVGIPLGLNSTEAKPLYNHAQGGSAPTNKTNARYSLTFKNTGVVPFDKSVVGELPPGLVYDAKTATISGTPRQAGTWEFTIGDELYTIKVEQATLRIYADYKERYYGETMLYDRATETNGPAYTLRYYTSDLCTVDLERVSETVHNDGLGSSLPALLGAGNYSAPVLLAQRTSGAVTTTVDRFASVGRYAINRISDGRAANYKLEYVRVGEKTSLPVGYLDIYPRPVYIGAFKDDYIVNADKPFFNDAGIRLNGLSASSGNGQEAPFQLELPTQSGENGTYGGLALTRDVTLVNPNDILTVTFDVEFQQLDRDKKAMEAGGGIYFALQEGEMVETRPVVLTNVELIESAASDNYQVTSYGAAAITAKGRVTRRPISKIEFVQLPKQTYTYGELVGANMRIRVTKEGQSQEESEVAVFDKVLFESRGYHVCWVTEEERSRYFDMEGNPDPYALYAYISGLEEGKSYGTPYKKFQVMTVSDHNERYLCIWTQTVDVENRPLILADFSQEDFTVLPRTLTLTLEHKQRYFGEENPALTFRYEPTQLAPADRVDGLTGAGAELEDVVFPSPESGYRPPVLTTALDLTEGAGEVTPGTPYVAGTYRYITVKEQAQINKNYVINYAVQTTPKGTISYDDNKGVATLSIYQRPVVLQSVESSELAPLGTIYADTKRQTFPVTGLTLDRFAVALPAMISGTNVSYFPRAETSAGSVKKTDKGMALTGSALIGGAEELKLSFTATVIPDNNTWDSDLTVNYYEMDHAVNGEQFYRVQITDVSLSGASAGSYVLVYDRNDDATYGMPSKRQYIGSEESYADGDPKTFYVALTADGEKNLARVCLRPIQAIQILSAPKMTYTYGEQFAPTTKMSAAARYPLRVQINYDTEFENDASNTHTETINFEITGEDDQGHVITSFNSRGLETYYVPAGSGLTEAKPLPMDTDMLVKVHTGARLVVAGQRPGLSGQTYSQASNEQFVVSKASLPVTVHDQYRYYGEKNGDFSFTVDREDLVERDRLALASRPDSDFTGTAAGVESGHSAPAVCPALSALEGYQGPVFQPTASQKSDVKNGGRTGYRLTLSDYDASSGDALEHALDNYKLVPTEAATYVLRRPVQIASIRSSAADPIYTIYADTTDRLFFTNVGNERVVMKFAERQDDSTETYQYANNAYDSVYADLLSTTPLPLKGGAICDGDEINLRLGVLYNIADNVDLGSLAQTSFEVRVNQARLTSQTKAYLNYCLVDETITPNLPATGGVELRSIQSIEIEAAPASLTYTYGQTLDLSSLKVKIWYKKLDSGVESGVNKSEIVTYNGPDFFHAYGLYVNYYDQPVIPGESQWPTLVNGRQADTGDHLTIAPTHDDPNFKHNGQYLVISARRHAEQKFVEPQIVQVSGATGAQGSPITVNPRRLEFALTAADKTYDGTGAGVGTLALENVFNEKAQSVSGKLEETTDVVYLSTGADYETPIAGGSLWSQYPGLLEHIRETGYIFTTGVYERTPYENGLKYTRGAYDAGDLTFTFTDPNVAYAVPPDPHSFGALTTVPVEVTNIQLKGPDAANYKIVPAVTEETLSTGVPGYESDALPEATIYKADRRAPVDSLRPTLELESHTNTLRLRYDQEIITDPNDQMGKDHRFAPHFEYAVQAVGQDEEGAAKLFHMAALNGTERYQDTTYFGGEMVLPALPGPDEYIPGEDQVPDELEEDAVLKGQLYAWAGEDPQTTFAADAFPGGEDFVYPGYYLYHNPRPALERGTAYWGLVRVAETWNYSASPTLSSVEGMTAAQVEEALAAEDALAAAEADQGARDRYAAALSDLENAASTAVAQAQAAADREVQELLALAESGDWPDEGQLDQTRPAAPVMKTYQERLDFLSTEELESAVVPTARSGEGTFVIPTLEAVWFTDLLRYEAQEQMTAVARNYNPTRYYSYYWDVDKSAQLEFSEEEPVDLSGPFSVEYTPQEESGGGDQPMMTVNENHTAVLYVGTQAPGGGGTEQSIRIVPGALHARLGDEPVRLSVRFTPSNVAIKHISWSCSNPRVAVVDRNGLVTFVGTGTATITATSRNGKTDRIAVSVLPAVDKPAPAGTAALFNWTYTAAFFALDEQLYFYPDQIMTRGELAVVLARFCRAESVQTPEEEAALFDDWEADAPWAQAVRLLSRAGVIQGVADGQFAGDQNVTRAELMTMLCRLLELEPNREADGPHAFVDSGPAETWAWGYIDAVAGQGIASGVGGGCFVPGRGLTRAECAVFLARLVAPASGMQMTGATQTPADVRRNHWAYDSILRAVNDLPPHRDEEENNG